MTHVISTAVHPCGALAKRGGATQHRVVHAPLLTLAHEAAVLVAGAVALPVRLALVGVWVHAELEVLMTHV